MLVVEYDKESEGHGIRVVTRCKLPQNIQSVLEFVILTHVDPGRNIIVLKLPNLRPRGRAAAGIRVRGHDNRKRETSLLLWPVDMRMLNGL